MGCQPGRLTRHLALRIRLLEPRERCVDLLRHNFAIRVALGDEFVEVDAVVPGSRAARAGLRPGDEILEIDEMPVDSPGMARSMLRGAEGVEAILRIRRGRRERLISVTRERYSVPR